MMHKLLLTFFLLLFIASGCGPSAEEKAQEEIRIRDSIAAHEAAQRAVDEANKAMMEIDTSMSKVESTVSAVQDTVRSIEKK